jgi:hypothetical protein
MKKEEKKKKNKKIITIVLNFIFSHVEQIQWGPVDCHISPIP